MAVVTHLAHADDRCGSPRRSDPTRSRPLFVDPFSRAFTGTSQHDSGEVGPWLVDLDLFARAEVGATDLVLLSTPDGGDERTRGASALEDWPDSIITMTRDEHDETSRYLKVIGRDVDVDEDLFAFDPETRRLTMTGRASRSQVTGERKIKQVTPGVVEFVLAHPGLLADRGRDPRRGQCQLRSARPLRLPPTRGLIDRRKEGPEVGPQAPRPTPSDLVGTDHESGPEPPPSLVRPPYRTEGTRDDSEWDEESQCRDGTGRDPQTQPTAPTAASHPTHPHGWLTPFTLSPLVRPTTQPPTDVAHPSARTKPLRIEERADH